MALKRIRDMQLQDGRRYVIDWGTAHYGSFYIDLPNYFNLDEVLLYRDALTEREHEIPIPEFLAHYDAVRPYPGFKYFGIGLGNWCYGDVPRRTEDVLHVVNMIVDRPTAWNSESLVFAPHGRIELRFNR